MSEPEEIQSLRKALSFSPENLALRQHLAEVLMRYGHYDAAVQEYSRALDQEPQETALRLGFATALFQAGEDQKAELVLEGLVTGSDVAGPASVVYARLLARRGQLAKAADFYSRALRLDDDLRRPELDEQLAVYLAEFTIDDAEDESEETFTEDGEPLPAGDLPPPDTERTEAGTEIEHPGISFADVGGMDAVKDEIRIKIIHPMEHQDLFKAYGKKAGGGILLYGPPGCGKTYISRATAGEVDARFISIGLHDVLDMYIGQSEQRLHEIFESARAHNPCVLFFDEVDALGAKRSDLRQSAGRNTINQFLSELDGIQGTNDGVLILAATNAPWHLDSAFRRPGRFDRIVFVPPPDRAARTAVLRVLIKDKPCDDVDLDALARKTEGFSGADLQSVVERTVEERLREAMKKGTMMPLRTKDLLRTAKSVKPSTRDWFSTARNYALYSNESGLYDDILDYLKIRK